MSKENTNQKASIVITITNEDGHTITKRCEGTNYYMALILSKFGILGREERKLLNE